MEIVLRNFALICSAKKCDIFANQDMRNFFEISKISQKNANFFGGWVGINKGKHCELKMRVISY